MSWSIIGGFLLVVLGLHAGLLLGRPGARTVATLAYATCALAALAIVGATALRQRDDAARAAELTARSAMDREFVDLLHLIDAARDSACNTQPPRSTDQTLLAAYTRMRTTCVFYMMMWIEASRASDVPGVLAAAEKPWPATGSPRQQLWSYGPLDALVARIESIGHRPIAPAETGSASRLAGTLPFALAGTIALAMSTVTAGFLYSTRGAARRLG